MIPIFGVLGFIPAFRPHCNTMEINRTGRQILFQRLSRVHRRVNLKAPINRSTPYLECWDSSQLLDRTEIRWNQIVVRQDCLEYAVNLLGLPRMHFGSR